jgi:hypothetical protein
VAKGILHAEGDFIVAAFEGKRWEMIPWCPKLAVTKPYMRFPAVHVDPSFLPHCICHSKKKPSCTETNTNSDPADQQSVRSGCCPQALVLRTQTVSLLCSSAM